MTESNQNFQMYQGETKNIIVSVMDGTSGNFVDLSGATITWALRERITSTNNLITKSSPNQITINGNTLTVHLITSDTASLSGAFFHECKMTDNLGNESELLNGIATILTSNL